MKTLLLFLAAIFAFVPLFSQVSVTDPGHDSLEVKKDSLPQKQDTIRFMKVMIVTFEPKVYASDADRELLAKSKITLDAMVGHFRWALAREIERQIPPFYEIRSVFSSSRDSVNDLDRIYGSIGYEKKPVTENTTAAKNILNKFKGGKEEKPVTKGQITIRQDNDPKYMATVINKKEVIPYLAKKYYYDYMVVVNMFEIRNDLTDYAAVGNNTYKREIRVHYSILDVNGREVAGGIAATTFPSAVNDCHQIAREYLPLLTGQITAHLPQPKIVKEKKR